MSTFLSKCIYTPKGKFHHVGKMLLSIHCVSGTVEGTGGTGGDLFGSEARQRPCWDDRQQTDKINWDGDKTCKDCEARGWAGK